MKKTSSTKETFGVGTLIAIPSNFPFREGIISPTDNSYQDLDTSIQASDYDVGSTITIKVYGDVRKFLGATSAQNSSYRSNKIYWSNTALKSVKIVGMSSITDCGNAFSNAINLESVDLTEFDSSNVTNMSYMFHKCSSIETMNLTGSFDVSKVTNFSYFFTF